MYIMNMMYAIYIKDTRIQGYENTMDICGDVDRAMAMSCATPGDEALMSKTRRARPDGAI